MTILPTVLFLICGVLRETAVKTADSTVSPPVSASLQAIKTIITSPLSRVEHIQQQWSSLVRSSLASVLEYSQPGEIISLSYTHTHIHIRAHTHTYIHTLLHTYSFSHTHTHTVCAHAHTVW